jgi:hypothetical protein
MFGNHCSRDIIITIIIIRAVITIIIIIIVILIIIIVVESRDGSIGIASGWTTRVRFPAGARFFF